MACRVGSLGASSLLRPCLLWRFIEGVGATPGGLWDAPAWAAQVTELGRSPRGPGVLTHVHVVYVLVPVPPLLHAAAQGGDGRGTLLERYREAGRAGEPGHRWRAQGGGPGFRDTPLPCKLALPWMQHVIGANLDRCQARRAEPRVPRGPGPMRCPGQGLRDQESLRAPGPFRAWICLRDASVSPQVPHMSSSIL